MSPVQLTCQIVGYSISSIHFSQPVLHHHLHNIYFFLPLGLDLEPAAFELVDTTLDAREGDVELALLPVADFTLSRALFCQEVLAHVQGL